MPTHPQEKVLSKYVLVSNILILLAAVSATNAQCPAYYVFNGEASNDRLGRSVASAGDVNDDGFTDLADIVYLAEYLNGTGPAPCAGSEPPPFIDWKQSLHIRESGELR